MQRGLVVPLLVVCAVVLGACNNSKTWSHFSRFNGGAYFDDYVGYTDETTDGYHWARGANEKLVELNLSGNTVEIRTRLKRNGSDLSANTCHTGTEGEGCPVLYFSNNNSDNENCWAYGKTWQSTGYMAGISPAQYYQEVTQGFWSDARWIDPNCSGE